MAGPIHYEVFIRKTAPSPWTLLMATEDRKVATETAEDLLADKRAVAVRVTKETLDPDTMNFNSVTVMTRGMPEGQKKRVVDPDQQISNCMAPQDLYAPSARDLIGRVLEDWLKRNAATAWELLHRPDLVEKLEASGVEVQHAIQKVAIPESQATGQASHELIRHYQKLTNAAMERVTKAGQRRVFANLVDHPLSQVAEKLSGSPDRAFVIGGVIAQALGQARAPRARLAIAMDLAAAAPAEGPARALVLVALEQFLIELLAARSNLADIFGPSLDQGASLAAIVRLVAPREIEALIAHDPRMALLIPTVDGPTARLAEHLAAGELPLLANSLARMVLRELMGPRRLRPADPAGEIDILRVLANALTATAGRLLSLEEVQNAFVERSKNLVTADFVQSFAEACDTVLCEAESLTRLCENVTGVANKRAASRWLSACVTSLRFESEMRTSPIRPSQKLHTLALLQRSVRASSLAEADEHQINAAIGAVGGVIETEAKLVSQLARASAPVPQKLIALLQMATGGSAPLGPVADRAKAEALRLLKAPEARAALGAEPQAVAQIRPLMKAIGLAA
jgi:hypothetical protein